jgi:hypothetical protein
VPGGGRRGKCGGVGCRAPFLPYTCERSHAQTCMHSTARNGDVCVGGGGQCIRNNASAKKAHTHTLYTPNNNQRSNRSEKVPASSPTRALERRIGVCHHSRPCVWRRQGGITQDDQRSKGSERRSIRRIAKNKPPLNIPSSVVESARTLCPLVNGAHVVV